MTADSGAYGRVWAADYDALFERREDTSLVTSFVTGLVPGGRVLELGVGTGRLAVPLAAAGLAVTGVDASPEMLDRLRTRPGGDQITAILGDFTSAAAGGPYDLVLIAFSTLFLVPSQDGQLAVLANARRHLRPGGLVVVEAFVPDHSRWTRDQNIAIGRLDSSGVVLKLSVHDPVGQLITIQDVSVDATGTSFRPNRLRYIWPAELDAMALASGLRLRQRTEDWGGHPFTAHSTAHVSLYEWPASGVAAG
jgi:SAM-dependent methyltransferase